MNSHLGMTLIILFSYFNGTRGGARRTTDINLK